MTINRQFNSLGLGVGDRHASLMRMYPGRDSPGPAHYETHEGDCGYRSQCGQFVTYPQWSMTLANDRGSPDKPGKSPEKAKA